MGKLVRTALAAVSVASKGKADTLLLRSLSVGCFCIESCGAEGAHFRCTSEHCCIVGKGVPTIG